MTTMALANSAYSYRVGGSGFIAGRSVWREVVSLVGPAREEFLTSVALPRLERLVDVAAHRARPWNEAGTTR